ncbi:hypothetical protein MMC18_007829 [Xylographa bjoerkii]|nr:hypothetical protein [Xylographa bjoerkii]
MPWRILLKLQITKQKKIQLLGIFLLGSFTCLAGTMSFVYIVLDGNPSTRANLSRALISQGISSSGFASRRTWGPYVPVFPHYLKTSIPLHRTGESTSRRSSYSTFIFCANSDAEPMTEDPQGKQRERSDSPIDVGGLVLRDVEAQWGRQESSGCAVVPKDTPVHEADGDPVDRTYIPNRATEAPQGPHELSAGVLGPRKSRKPEVDEMPTIAEVLPVEPSEAPAGCSAVPPVAAV